MFQHIGQIAGNKLLEELDDNKLMPSFGSTYANSILVGDQAPKTTTTRTTHSNNPHTKEPQPPISLYSVSLCSEW